MKNLVFLIFSISFFCLFAGNNNQADCERFCEKDKYCTCCSTLRSCGVGFERIKSFKNKGKNYYACRKKGSINVVWERLAKVTKDQKVLVVGVGGYSGMYTDDGIELFCEKYLNSKNHKNILCISSYGRPKTSSRQLSENIRKTAMLMEKTSGVKPKVIMIGKSMGACKLHHAVAGEKGGARGDLDTFAIDLFIGVDMSCHVKRHYETPGDILLFRNNIKEFYNFYQNHKNASQTGHRAYFLDTGFDDSVHINVNTDSFDVAQNKKIKNAEKPLCKDARHLTIDNCEPLLETIQKIILKKMEKEIENTMLKKFSGGDSEPCILLYDEYYNRLEKDKSTGELMSLIFII